jgi:hypothetical protein
MTDLLTIGVDAWIIQDGNYPDFARDDRAAFAVEFYASAALNQAEPKSTLRPSLVNTEPAHCEALGRVVHVADDWWAIDVGAVLFREEKPPINVRLGNWMSGEIYVGVDPYFYFERLAYQPDAPGLIYDWRVEKIEIQTAPFIKRGRMIIRDTAQLGWKEIAQTDAWADDDGHAEYVLHCRRVSRAGRRTR